MMRRNIQTSGFIHKTYLVHNLLSICKPGNNEIPGKEVITAYVKGLP